MRSILTLTVLATLLIVPSATAIDLQTLQKDLASKNIRNEATDSQERIQADGNNALPPSVPPTDPVPETNAGVRRGVVTVTTSLNVRKGAWGPIIGGLPPGAEVEIIGRDGEFWQIRYPGGTACVHSGFVRLAGGGDAPGTTDPGNPGTPEPVTPGQPGGGSATETPLDPTDFNANGGMSGSDFMARIANLSGAAREQAVLQAVQAGNIPASLLQFRTVTQTRTLSDGRSHTVRYRVAPDYLAIGTDADHVRIPMTPVTAQAIADRMGCLLPTRRMVDQIYAAADTRLSPRAMSDGSYPDWQRRMTTSGFYAEHDRLVDRQLGGNPSPGLLAGHKKDVVITNRLDSKPRSVAIYGWHRSNGSPIQPLSTVHENSYADYSHGIRLVAGTCTVDGREMAMADVLRDPVLSGLVSDEGAIRNPRATR